MYFRTLSPHLPASTPPIIKHYQVIAFALYIIGFVAFVLSLRKHRLYKYQFGQFAFCHMALLVVVAQSTFLISNAFAGMIWFLLPVSLVICNDCSAYVFGFFFGRTPLIRLSPKKTWEGFIGGALTTLVFALLFSRLLTLSPYMTCPRSGLGLAPLDCDPDPVFLPVPARDLFPMAARLWAPHGPTEWLGSVTVAPVQVHGFIMACFASLVAPFGGFFASGFKRAFKIKDFGTTIPGHGGFVDRMDCQIIMGMFVYVYHSNYVHVDTSYYAALLLRLHVDDQLALYHRLRDSLAAAGALP